MAYELNEKMKQRTVYPVDTQTYRIRLDANESFLDPGKQFPEALQKAITEVSLNRYPDDTYFELRKAFAALYQVDPAAVMPGNGSDEIISYLIGGFMMNGETLLTFSPDFSMYGIYAQVSERKHISVPKQEDGKFNAEFMAKAAKETNAAVILFSNPVSSIGNIISREEIRSLVENTTALVVVDEAYMDFADQSVIDLVSCYDNLVVLKTCSKALGCAGIRLGFSIAPIAVATALNSVRPPYHLNSLTDAIGRLILSNPEAIRTSIKTILLQRDFLFAELKKLEGNEMIDRVRETHANYICIETGFAQTIYERLKRESILVRNLGQAIRVTVGTPEENQEFLRVFQQIIA